MEGVEMSDEQRSAINYCVLSVCLRRKTIEMILQDYGDSAAKLQQCINGIRGLRRADKTRVTTSAQAVP